ncbi:MAG: biotin transporter BioY [Spirochaetaceae bacterium]|nr:biotin transporter BioY [Spirochaetaceae bacterium]
MVERSHPHTLIDRLWPPAGSASGSGTWAANLFRVLFLALVGSLLIAVSSKIKVPMVPVPMTLQTLVILVIGMAAGWRLGGLTVLLYLLEGAVGLPVFAGTPERGIGLAYMVGTTGGYLLGFLLATLVIGLLAEAGWDRSVPLAAAAMLIGNVVIYVPGLLWLGSVAGWDNPILQWGLTPFIVGDLVKLAIAALLMPAVWRLVRTN